MHRATTRFWKSFNELPKPIQRRAKRHFQLLKTDPHHPSLNFKRIGEVWSVRAGFNYRAIAVEDGDDYIWVWIGTHDEYVRLLKDNR